jgi:predicted nucleotidyltransferase
MESACRSLDDPARSTGKSEADVRNCTYRMLTDSTTRLQAVRDACEALAYRMESGIRAIVVAGSVARCEAIPTSDVDFNVYVTDAYMATLYTSKSVKAKSSHDLLMGLERELRKKMRMDVLVREMQDRGYPEWETSPTLKPFTLEQLYGVERPNLNVGHLLNLVFSATPVLGEREFESLLDDLLRDPYTIQGALLGRIALLHARGSLIRASAEVVPAGEMAVQQTSNPLDALHAVAGAISSLLCAGLSDGDPQMPYWWTMDAITASALEPATRETIERFFVVVTLARGGMMDYDVVALSELLERTFAALPLAIETVLQWQAARGASDETLSIWEDIAVYVADPLATQELARHLRMTSD